jgi:DNA-binding CsgD family transcriptional regulator
MFLHFLDRISCGGILIDAEGLAVRLNRAAYRILREHNGLPFRPQDGAQALQGLDRMLDCEVRGLREEELFIIRQKHERWPIVVRVLPPAEPDASMIAVILLDLNLPPRLDARSVQKAFGLTAAESNLAIEIARGSTVSEISRSQEVSLNTVRAHLTSTFSKTHTRRQAELSAILVRLSVISS